MGRADLHIHTTYSWDGTCSVPAVLKKAAEIGLDVIAITDHDEVRGGLEALELAELYKVGVIPGCEISTADGHLLAYFIQRRIAKGLPLAATLQLVGEQGGICVAAHPSARGANSLTPRHILAALQHPEQAKVLVGIEVFNSGLFHLGSNRLAKSLADTLPVAQVGNSDAHMTWMIGNGSTSFAGSSVQELRLALERGDTQAESEPLNPRLLIVGSWLSRYALRKAGWVSGNTSPDAPLRFVRQH